MFGDDAVYEAREEGYQKGYNEARNEIIRKIRTIYSEGHLARILEREFPLK